jgi:beta-exotoxin I transport system permease protein
LTTTIGRSRVLFAKQWRQQRGTGLACGALLLAFALVIVVSFRAFGDVFEEQVMGRMASGAMGEIFFGGAPQKMDFLSTYLSIAFTHPLVLILLCVFAIAVASRALAGEIERGTVDVLLALPVTRLQFALASGAACAAGLALLLLVHWAGLRLGLQWTGVRPPGRTLSALGYASLNLAALAFCVGGYSFLCSALASERGRAAGLAAGITVTFYFFNVLAQLWERAKFMENLSIFHYHRPLPLLTSGAPAWGDLAVLCSLAALTFLAALWLFARRDIATL